LSTESTVETVFGSKTKKDTYYVSGTKQMGIDTEVALDLTTWDVVERPFELNGETIMLKWLHLSNTKPVANVVRVAETVA
jgi:hypothetical protein